MSVGHESVMKGIDVFYFVLAQTGSQVLRAYRWAIDPFGFVLKQIGNVALLVKRSRRNAATMLD